MCGGTVRDDVRSKSRKCYPDQRKTKAKKSAERKAQELEDEAEKRELAKKICMMKAVGIAEIDRPDKAVIQGSPK